MSWLSDRAIERLRNVADAPDLSGTRYRLLERVGRGGMGVVYLAEDVTLRRGVALKVLDTPDPNGALTARLLREARILAQLEHPGIVPVHDVGTLADGRLFYTMKFVQGRRLDEQLRSLPALRDRLRIFLSICDAVAFAHTRGVLHRDLKPENIMVGPFGEVLVMDWGIAKARRETDDAAPARTAMVETKRGASRPALDSDTTAPAEFSAAGETAHGVVLGTPGYMAPEQARGDVDRLDERADIYSLGALLRYLVAAGSPSTNAVPRLLAAIRAKAMAEDPGRRYPTAEALAADVARYLDGEPVEAYPEGFFDRAGRLVSKHRIALILVLAFLVVRALLLILFGR